MTFDDLYRHLESRRHPVDLAQEPDAEPEADGVVYRLGFSSVPLAGMPERVDVGRVEIHRTVGPIATQRVAMRQRHGLPVVFDKAMELGAEVGANEVLTVCQIADEPPEDAGAAFRDWREEASAACGLLAAVLDERIAIEQVFEDLIVMRGGEPISSADARLLLRSFLPLDVTEEERRALADLHALRLDGLPALSEAARWYLRAAQEGPTADAIVFLWIAMEALTPAPRTNPKMLEAMLMGAGFDPAWLGDLTMGRLAGLRADIVHKGAREHPLIRAGFYRLETVARVLIRHAAGVVSRWPPSLVAGVFDEARDEVERQLAERETVWHEGGLPPPDEPVPAGLAWDRIQSQIPELRASVDVTVSGDLQPGYERRVRLWVEAAAQFLDVSVDPFLLRIEDDPAIPPSVQMAVNRERIVLRPELMTLPDPIREMRLAWLIQQGLAQMAVMRSGIDSVSFGAALVELGGAWAGWRAFYGPGAPLEGEDLKIRGFESDDLTEIGGLTGAALAGSSAAAGALQSWEARTDVDSELVDIFKTLLGEWSEIGAFRDLLAAIQELAQTIDGTRDQPT